MKEEPVFVRKVSPEEKEKLEKGLRSADACEMKRAQILLASSAGLSTFAIAKQYGYSAEYARQMIHRFNQAGVACLLRKSSARLKQKKILDADTCQVIKQRLKESPRQCGKHSSVWTLTLMCEVMFERGETSHQIANETLRRALKENGVAWKRAKDWIRSPDEQYQLKKTT